MAAVIALSLAGCGAAGGGPIAPPAGWTRSQADDAVLVPALAAAGGQGPLNIRFQWAFTTGLPTAELAAAIAGLDGHGPLAHLATAIPPRIERIDDLRAGLFDGSPYTLDAGPLAEALGIIAQLARFAGRLDPGLADLADLIDLFNLTGVDYIAFGSIIGPDLRVGPSETFDVDLATGRAPARPGRTTFLLAVPRPCPENGFAHPPYDLVLTGHGNGRSRLDGAGVAAAATRHGYAVLAFDAPGHGPDDALTRLPQMVAQAVSGNVAAEIGVRSLILMLSVALATPVDPTRSVEEQLRHLCYDGPIGPITGDGRAMDVDGDRYTDSGETFFTADVFRTRDIVRQTAIDAASLVRVFRGLGADRNGNGRLDPSEGDLDGDGVLDAGGPGARFVYTGISLGGINGAVIAGVDPLVERADLMVPGGGLTDIVLTSDLRSVTERVFRDVFGLVIIGNPDGAGGANVALHRQGGAGRIATAPGGTIVATNVMLGLSASAPVAADGGFRVHVGADPGDPITLESRDLQGAVLGTLAFPSPGSGLGLERSTPRFREWIGLAALGLEPADPIAYAQRWAALPGRGGQANVLIQVSLGDRTVPVFTGAALGRAAGFISAARDQVLASSDVLRSGTTLNLDRVFGVESRRDQGIRLLGVNAHAGMLVPNPSSLFDGARYAAAAQRQAFGFRAGRYAVRFEVREGDQPGSRGYRSEIEDPYDAPAGTELRYGFSIRIPEDFPIQRNRCVIGQWWAPPDSPAEKKARRSPALAQRYENGAFRVTLRFDEYRPGHSHDEVDPAARRTGGLPSQPRGW